MISTKFTVLADQVQTVAKWERDGRGLLLWESHDIGANRSDLLTPVDAEKPHWAYVKKEELRPEEITVELREYVELPCEDFPRCEHCDDGRRSVAQLATIRCEHISKTRAMLSEPDSNWKLCDDIAYFVCNYCKGTGHDVKPITFNVKRQYWGGYQPSKTGVVKCEKMANRLAKIHNTAIEYDWEFTGYAANLAQAKFFKVQRMTLAEYLDRRLDNYVSILDSK